MKIFDVHHHFGYHLSGLLPEISEDFIKRIEVMDSCGISTAVIMPSPDYYMPNGISDTKKVNEKMADYKKHYPDKFPVALGTVEPRHGKVSVTEIDRMINELKLDGVMWHHRFQGTPIDHDMTKLYLAKISELSVPVPVFIHNYSESTLEAPERLEILAKEFPNLTFVSLDSLSSPNQMRRMLQVAKRQGNIFLETGMMFPLQNVIERVAGEIGSHRLLFGSDTYTNPTATDPEIIIEIIIKAKISEVDKANILEKNARNIFGLDPH
ncbi:amidohydrolase family protein [Thermodesulfobacteriota bacterium]